MATKTKPVAKKAAAKRPVKAANKWANVQLPEGYTAITNGDFGEPWDFENEPVLEGVIVGEIREVETGKGRDKRMSKVATMQLEDGRAVTVWESAALRGWFERIYDGAQVSVAFQGYRDVGKASLMKVFVGAILEDDEPAPRKKPAAKKTTRR